MLIKVTISRDPVCDTLENGTNSRRFYSDDRFVAIQIRFYLKIQTVSYVALIISMLLLKRSASTPRRLHNISVLTVFLDSLLLNLSLVRFFGSAFIPCLYIDGTVGISLIDLLS